MNDNNTARPPRRRGSGGHGPAHMMPGEKAKNFKQTMGTLLQYIKPFRFKVAVVVLFAMAGTLFSILSPVVLGMATDTVVQGILGSAGINFEKLLSIIATVGILYGISFLFSFMQSFIMSGVAQQITYNLRKQMSEKMDRLPLKYFDSKTHGEILSRVTNDIETVNQSLSQSMTQIITSATTIIGVLAMMLYISFTMTLVALIVLPLSLIIIRVVVNHSQKYFKRHQQYLGEINGHVEEMYTGHVIVKAFNGEEKSLEDFKDINDKLYDSAWHSQFFSGMMMPLTNLIGNLAYVFVCIVGGYLAINGRITIGSIQAFIQYVRSFNQPISQIANVANVLQSTAAAAERVFEFIQEEDEINPSIQTSAENAAAAIDLTRIKGEVVFDHVEFGYSDDKILIHDFTFTAKPGQRIAIVGPTGAGKTTIVKLLMRFYELSGGSIYIDGTNILDFSRNQLRSMFSMVLQDTWLFNGSIKDNIRYGDVTASDEQVIAAAKAAHIHHFIKTQSNGYDMEVNEEASNISQGQKQLLTIARAFLADSPILILDEATSSVDTRTESLIQQAMSGLMQGRTSFIIAHRLSTIRDADMILVMNDGDIIEHGTHAQLLEKQGFYADLYNSQF